jgi:hypothetical protein
VTSVAACLLCCGPVGPDEPRCPAFAQAGVVVHVDGRSGCRVPSHGTAGRSAKQPKAAP